MGEGEFGEEKLRKMCKVNADGWVIAVPVQLRLRCFSCL